MSWEIFSDEEKKVCEICFSRVTEKHGHWYCENCEKFVPVSDGKARTEKEKNVIEKIKRIFN